VQGVIMVAGAVVASSQTTSVRAANLLASFIIVPMALLIQGEAAALFWGNHAGLWWLLLGLTITAMVLIRMGIHIFNREELMGQEIDQVRLGWMWGQFWQQFSGRAQDGRYPGPFRWFRQTLRILRQLHFPAVASLIAMSGAVGLGLFLAHRYPFPPDIQARLQGEEMVANVASLQGFAGALPLIVLLHNIRVVLLQTLLGVFTFGVLGLLVFMVPWGLIGFIAAQFSIAGEDPFAFLLATILPHAILEMPALIIAAAAALRWHAVVIAPPPERTLSEGFLMAAADFVRLFVGVVVPLLAVAAVVEAYLTPLVLVRVYGG